MSSIDKITQLSSNDPDSKMCGCDGEFPVHTSLLAVHSTLLSEIFKTIPDRSESILILPDFYFQEIKTLGKVMYGLEESGLFSDKFLKTHVFFCFRNSKG